MKTFMNVVAGASLEPSTGKYFDNNNPADTTDIMSRFPLSTVAELEKAVASANRGHATERPTPATPNQRAASPDPRRLTAAVRRARL